MNNKCIEKTYEKLLDSKQRIETAIRELQSVCTHSQAVVNKDCDTGNWCSSDDSYWVTVKCPSCGYYKRFDSVDDVAEYKKWSNL